MNERTQAQKAAAIKAMNDVSKAVLEKRDVTGRDSYVIAKALAYAIEAINLLPEERREYSDPRTHGSE